MLNCAHVQICKKSGRETVDHAPAAGYSSQSCGSAPRRGQADAVRDLIWCQAVPRTFATVLLPPMRLLPIQIPHTKNWRSRGDARITNHWSGGSLRPPDTRRASVFALQDTVRVSGGRALPPDQWFVSLQERCHLYGDLYGGEEHQGRKQRSEGSRYRLTPYEVSNSICLPPSWRGTARFGAIASSWRVVDRFPGVFLQI